MIKISKKMLDELDNKKIYIPPVYLANKNPHDWDISIRFDEEPHNYYIKWDGSTEELCDTSVTGFIKHNFPPFDADKIIANMRTGKNFHKSKYFGQTDEEIKAGWEELRDSASFAGTNMHRCIEHYYNGMDNDEKDDTYELSLFKTFAKEMEDMKIQPFRTEWMVRTDDNYKLVGSVDMLYFSKRWDRINKNTGRRELHLIMFDWKRSKLIKRWSREKGFGCCSRIPNANYFHYCLQLNSYKYIIEHFYKNMKVNGIIFDDIIIDRMHLLVCHPNLEKASNILVSDYSEEMALMFEERKQNIQLRKKSKKRKRSNINKI